MASRSGTIGAALVAWLNDGARSWPSVGASWTAVQTWVPEIDLATISTILVEVVPESLTGRGLATRGSRDRTFTQIVNVRQRYDVQEPLGSTAGQAWIEARVALVEAMEQQLGELTLTSQPSGTLCTVENVALDPLYDLTSLLGPRMFDSLIEVNFSETRLR